ncbi:hypothetical protein CUJ89_28565 [Burkholderia pyrrocinia]|uniref:Uncharacterized protein n=1 Tax=Burkholderia pyrrocinia TaxID=60550 RepID=A0A2Z5N3Y4_BURPY|nr:hypothetical protein [Burkholderia pyrrocinia]AXF24265.1 hypothetical protein CUJ89_28565 [Burkholderia pyrrocinia]
MSIENNVVAVVNRTEKRSAWDLAQPLMRSLTADLSPRFLVIQTIVITLVITLLCHFWLGPWMASHISYPWLSQWRWIPLPWAIGYVVLIGTMRHRSLMAVHARLGDLPKDAPDDVKRRLKSQVERKRTLYKMIGEIFAAMSVFGVAFSLVTSYYSFDTRFLRPAAAQVDVDLARIRELTEQTCRLGVTTDACTSRPSVSQMVKIIEKETDVIQRHAAVTAMLDRLRPVLLTIQGNGRDELARLLDEVDAAFPNDALFSLLQMTAASFLVLTVTVAVGFKLAVAVYEYRITLQAEGEGAPSVVRPEAQRRESGQNSTEQ